MLLITLTTILLTNIALSYARDGSPEEKCSSLKTCKECIGTDSCAWCVTRSKCKHSCGMENAIHSESDTAFTALLAGPQFCPRVQQTDDVIVESGKKKSFSVKITQVHVYMVFTPWKCKIVVDGKELVVNAIILADTVFCEAVELTKDVDKSIANGHVQVLWQNNNALDGFMPIKLM